MKKIILEEGIIKEMSCEDVCIKFKNLIYKMAYKYGNCGEFEDLTQIAYMGLIKAYKSYDYNKKICFITYSVKVIQNEFLLIFRKIKKQIKPISLQSESEQNAELLDMIDNSINYEEVILNKITVNNTIDKLKEIDKQIISLKTKGLSQIDISKKVGISSNAVSQRLKRARKKIREEIK